MNENHRTKQSPCATLSINVEHSEYLQEPDASDGARCKHLAVTA